MSSEDDRRPRRDIGRPEDNPFIAFRRFADSQVSSLLNTVFTLPATIANYNNAHQAREQCLFGKADQRQCDKLQELEAEITDLRHEGREVFRAGDVKAVLRNSETLMRLDRKADDIRKDIIEKGPATADGDKAISRRDDAELVEKVAIQKGREWGGSWDWGFPKPFDHDRKPFVGSSEDDVAREMQELNTLLRLQSEVQKLVAAFDGEAWDDPPTKDTRHSEIFDTRPDTEESHERSWCQSWEWPQPGDASRYEQHEYSPQVLDRDQRMRTTGIPWQKAYDDLLRGEQIEQSHDEPSYEYSHDHEDQHDEPPTSTSYPLFPFVDRIAEEDPERISRLDPATKTFLQLRQQRRQDYMAQLEQDSKAHNALKATACAAQEQEDEETEMDAYEHLEAMRKLPESSTQLTHTIPEKAENTVPSILSTMTTTERTVAPDGSITTKVVLKKRFADGREENSETVHVHRNTEAEIRPHFESSVPVTRTRASAVEEQETKEDRKRSGWFWSN